MNNVDKQYNDLLKDIIANGDFRGNTRTGEGMTSLSMQTVKHDMRDGFPLISSRRVPIKSAMVELEGFINGITDKGWYQERGCKFWDYWCDPRKVPYGTDTDTLKAMKEESELGEIYGAQWRNFHDAGIGQINYPDNYANVPTYSHGVDQLKILIDKLTDGVYDRRLLVSAWNPLAFHAMALVPCHTDFAVYTNDEFIDLQFNMRSNDLPLGYPSNQAFYAMLLILLGKQADLTPRFLKHNIIDAHIYSNQMDGINELLTRDTFDPLPQMEVIIKDELIFGWTILDWTHEDYKLHNYQNSGTLKFPTPAI